MNEGRKISTQILSCILQQDPNLQRSMVVQTWHPSPSSGRCFTSSGWRPLLPQLSFWRVQEHRRGPKSIRQSAFESVRKPVLWREKTHLRVWSFVKFSIGQNRIELIRSLSKIVFRLIRRTESLEKPSVIPDRNGIVWGIHAVNQTFYGVSTIVQQEASEI